MKNEMKHGLEPKEETAAVEKLQADVEMLQDALRRVEAQVAKLTSDNSCSGINNCIKAAAPVFAGERPSMAEEKAQRCKHCSNMRMPHKSNPHYTCGLRHETIEPNWTCAEFETKNYKHIPGRESHASH